MSRPFMCVQTSSSIYAQQIMEISSRIHIVWHPVASGCRRDRPPRRRLWGRAPCGPCMCRPCMYDRQSRSRLAEYVLCRPRDATANPTARSLSLLHPAVRHYSQRVPQHGDSAFMRLRLATPCCSAPCHVPATLRMLLFPHPQGNSSRACAFMHVSVACAIQPDSC